MVARCQRRRGWQGYLLNDLHLPWPKDVTEAEKEQWKSEYEQLFNVTFPVPMSLVSGRSQKPAVPIKLSTSPKVPDTEMTWTGAPYDIILLKQFKKDILEQLESELSKLPPNELKRLQVASYEDGVFVKVTIGDRTIDFPLVRT